MSDPRDVKLDSLPAPADQQDRKPSIFRRVLVAIVRFVVVIVRFVFSASGVQAAGAIAVACGAFVLLPLAVWLIVFGVVVVALGTLREAGRI